MVPHAGEPVMIHRYTLLKLTGGDVCHNSLSVSDRRSSNYSPRVSVGIRVLEIVRRKIPLLTDEAKEDSSSRSSVSLREILKSQSSVKRLSAVHLWAR